MSSAIWVIFVKNWKADIERSCLWKSNDNVLMMYYKTLKDNKTSRKPAALEYLVTCKF